MYQEIERELETKEIRFLKTKIRDYERRLRFRYRSVLLSGVLGYGVAGLICVLGNLLSDDKPPLWFSMLIFWGAGTFLTVSLARATWRETAEKNQLLTRLRDALENGRVRVERIQSQRMIEVEEREDEGACYLFEIDDKRLFQLYGQEYYSTENFPSTDFRLIDILDSEKNPVASLVEKHGEKMKPYKIIGGTDPIKNIIPYEQTFFPCGIDEFEEYVQKQDARARAGTGRQ